MFEDVPSYPEPDGRFCEWQAPSPPFSLSRFLARNAQPREAPRVGAGPFRRPCELRAIEAPRLGPFASTRVDKDLSPVFKHNENLSTTGLQPGTDTRAERTCTPSFPEEVGAYLIWLRDSHSVLRTATVWPMHFSLARFSAVPRKCCRFVLAVLRVLS